MNNLKVGVIGGGMVGDATVRQLELPGRIRDIVVYDKAVEGASPDNLESSEFIFICVPSYPDDMSAVDDAVGNAVSRSSNVVIRSTLRPGQTARYTKQYPDNSFCFMPEFFRERTRVEDALRPDKLIFGVDTDDGLGKACMALFEHLECPVRMVVSTAGAEMIKLSINAYYTTRIVLANQIHDVARALGVPWAEVRDGVYADKRIDPTGFDVLLDGFRGAGGKCLPKDLDILIDAADEACVEVPMLKSIADVNNGLLGRKKP